MFHYLLLHCSPRILLHQNYLLFSCFLYHLLFTLSFFNCNRQVIINYLTIDRKLGILRPSGDTQLDKLLPGRGGTDGEAQLMFVQSVAVHAEVSVAAVHAAQRVALGSERKGGTLEHDKKFAAIECCDLGTVTIGPVVNIDDIVIIIFGLDITDHPQRIAFADTPLSCQNDNRIFPQIFLYLVQIMLPNQYFHIVLN